MTLFAHSEEDQSNNKVVVHLIYCKISITVGSERGRGKRGEIYIKIYNLRLFFFFFLFNYYHYYYNALVPTYDGQERKLADNPTKGF